MHGPMDVKLTYVTLHNVKRSFWSFDLENCWTRDVIKLVAIAARHKLMISTKAFQFLNTDCKGLKIKLSQLGA
jgi:hypothetical protein